MWWHGFNIAQDSGTYLYNADAPWDNSLTSAFVHNTVTVDGIEFMYRAGRFLYLDWAQAEIEASSTDQYGIISSLTVQHNGYRKLGLYHSRKVTVGENGEWEVIDRLDGSADLLHIFRLHWLLPDWEYEIDNIKNETDSTLFKIRIRSPFGWISLSTGVLALSDGRRSDRNSECKLVRAGELVYGSGLTSPILGWVSPTYGDKIPALSYIIEIAQSIPIEMMSKWKFPHET